MAFATTDVFLLVFSIFFLASTFAEEAFLPDFACSFRAERTFSAEKGGRVLRVPALGDHAAYDLPKGNFTFKLFTLRVEPRNYNIIL